MEVIIKVAATDVTITVPNHDFSERELKLIEVMILNVSTPLNAYVTGENMVFNPLERHQNNIFHYQFAWNMMLVEDLYNRLEELLHRRIETVMQMSDINHASVTLKANFIN